MAHFVVKTPGGVTVLGPLQTSEALSGKEVLERIQASGKLAEGRVLAGRCKLLLGDGVLGEEQLLEGGQEDTPLMITAVVMQSADGIPPSLAITHTSECPSGWEAMRKMQNESPVPGDVNAYVGLWLHAPTTNNPHVFTQQSSPNITGMMLTGKNGKIFSTSAYSLYWQDDNLHWRVSLRGKESADPEHPHFGRGSYHFEVPGGPDQKYSKYETDGLTFTWDPSKEEQELVVPDKLEEPSPAAFLKHLQHSCPDQSCGIL